MVTDKIIIPANPVVNTLVNTGWLGFNGAQQPPADDPCWDHNSPELAIAPWSFV